MHLIEFTADLGYLERNLYERFQKELGTTRLGRRELDDIESRLAMGAKYTTSIREAHVLGQLHTTIEVNDYNRSTIVEQVRTEILDRIQGSVEGQYIGPERIVRPFIGEPETYHRGVER